MWWRSAWLGFENRIFFSHLCVIEQSIAKGRRRTSRLTTQHSTQATIKEDRDHVSIIVQFTYRSSYNCNAKPHIQTKSCWNEYATRGCLGLPRGPFRLRRPSVSICARPCVFLKEPRLWMKVYGKQMNLYFNQVWLGYEIWHRPNNDILAQSFCVHIAAIIKQLLFRIDGVVRQLRPKLCLVASLRVA